MGVETLEFVVFKGSIIGLPRFEQESGVISLDCAIEIRHEVSCFDRS